MKSKPKHIKVFEHQQLKLNQVVDGVRLDEQTLQGFTDFYGDGVPYFSLIRDGIQFNEYVGAIQVGNTLVEVLPKADKKDNNKSEWQERLIGMLRAVHGFEVKAPSSSSLKVNQSSILDLYFELFITEVELILRRGLIKQYRQTEGNLNALKGRLVFSKHISKNLVHKERFYTQYTTYDVEHVFHMILCKALLLIQRLNRNKNLFNRINGLVLNFPEMPDIKVNESTFEKITYNRKSLHYKKAIDISHLLLMHYHPNLQKGNRDVLALMFDMNQLWEEFVLVSLRKLKEFKVRGQNSTGFWKPKNGRTRTIRPDIKIFNDEDTYILDTKWKMIDRRPSIEDVRQMYAYHMYFFAKKVALLYPGKQRYIKGNFIETGEKRKISDLECGLLFVDCKKDIRKWQEEIRTNIENWIE